MGRVAAFCGYLGFVHGELALAIFDCIGDLMRLSYPWGLLARYE